MFKIAFYPMFDNFNVNFRKNKGFLTCIPCIPIPEYGESNAPLVIRRNLYYCYVIASFAYTKTKMAHFNLNLPLVDYSNTSSPNEWSSMTIQVKNFRFRETFSRPYFPFNKVETS